VSDEIQWLSEELARDPSSLVFLELGEQLRRRSDLDVALRIALRGLERHPHHPEAHDLLARICVDRGELERAFDEWDMVLRLAPNHVGAHKGIGYVLFKQGRAAEAERHLDTAAGLDSSDETIMRALTMVRESLRGNGAAATGNGMAVSPNGGTLAVSQLPDLPDLPAPGNGSGSYRAVLAQPQAPDARMLFVDVLGQGEHTALLVDSDGLVTAGVYVTTVGDDVSHEIGAALSAIREEAERATTHVQLGDWQVVVVEAQAATIALAPASHGATVMLAAADDMPLGFVRRTLERCRVHATKWLEETA
jgi:predicted regulator of Ras-like GTPase activity (Roadblock/LC7/MglB family)